MSDTREMLDLRELPSYQRPGLHQQINQFLVHLRREQIALHAWEMEWPAPKDQALVGVAPIPTARAEEYGHRR